MANVIRFQDLKIGQSLRTQGVQSSDGVFVAEKIVIKAPAEHTVIKGPILKIQGNVLSVLNCDITIPAYLETQFAGMRPGQVVELKGKYLLDQGLLLDSVEQKDSADASGELQGEIESIDRASHILQVAGIPVKFSENTIISVDSALVYSPLYQIYFEDVGERQYRSSTRVIDSWGGPFNGQVLRQELFAELVRKICFSAIIETGTFRGTTTAYMHQTTHLPLYTVELHPQYYGYAKARFSGNDEIDVRRGDSRVFLRQLSQDSELTGKQVFCYLDAHWPKDLPLLEEVRIVFEHWFRAVIMIDDFRVPGDTGYGYDHYGPDRELTLEYLRPLKALNFSAFFPAKGSQTETGRKRGCVVLAKDPDLVLKLNELENLTACSPLHHGL